MFGAPLPPRPGGRLVPSGQKGCDSPTVLPILPPILAAIPSPFVQAPCPTVALRDQPCRPSGRGLGKAMAQFTSDGLSLAYDDFGPTDARKAIVLVHGFSANRYENWKRMGWYDALAAKGLRGLAFDNRGHG